VPAKRAKFLRQRVSCAFNARVSRIIAPTYNDGILSRVNQTAMRMGARPGIRVRDYVEILSAPTSSGPA
jgi:hypothetical protein